MKTIRHVSAIALILLLAGCGGGRLRPVGPSVPAGAPRYIELYSEVSAATLHFPRGTYSLHAADAKGYYYRAPRQILQNTATGRVARDGGLFVSKKNLKKVRGYVFWQGALTHVGNFSRKQYAFRE